MSDEYTYWSGKDAAACKAMGPKQRGDQFYCIKPDGSWEWRPVVLRCDYGGGLRYRRPVSSGNVILSAQEDVMAPEIIAAPWGNRIGCLVVALIVGGFWGIGYLIWRSFWSA